MAPRILYALHAMDSLHIRPTSFPIRSTSCVCGFRLNGRLAVSHLIVWGAKTKRGDMISKHGKTNFGPFGQWI